LFSVVLVFIASCLDIHVDLFTFLYAFYLFFSFAFFLAGFLFLSLFSFFVFHVSFLTYFVLCCQAMHTALGISLKEYMTDSYEVDEEEEEQELLQLKTTSKKKGRSRFVSFV